MKDIFKTLIGAYLVAHVIDKAYSEPDPEPKVKRKRTLVSTCNDLLIVLFWAVAYFFALKYVLTII